MNANGTVDLFKWSTASTYYGIHNSLNDATYSGDFKDWGEIAISNGGNTANAWRTLSKDEWGYLLKTRSTTSGIRYAKATVNSITGLIIVPDDWSTSYYSLSATNTYGSAYTSNVISSSTWTNSLEAHGAVFLPTAGYRTGQLAVDDEAKGCYWSSTQIFGNSAYYLNILSGNVSEGNIDSRSYAYSVRLVSDVPPTINVEGNSDIAVVADFDEVTYTGSPVAPGITVTYQSTALTEGTDYDITYEGVTPTSYGPSTTAPTNAGSYNVVLTFKGGFAGTLEKAFTISKAAASLSLTPAAVEGLQYTGTAQTLISGGTATGGTLQYSLDGSNWSEELPTASAVGSYTVWYKVVGDGNHNNIDPASFTVTISKPTMVITAKEDPKNLGVFYSTFFYSLFSYTLPAGVEAYAAELSTDALNLTQVASAGDVIPADNAFILKADNNSITLIPSDEAGIDMSGIANSLQGVDAETEIASAVTGTCYVLSGTNEDGVGFFLYQAPNQLKAHKAFVDKPGGLSSAPKRLRFVFNATTGVESIQNSAISSQKVLRDGQLIIIRNGVEYNAAGQMIK